MTHFRLLAFLWTLVLFILLSIPLTSTSGEGFSLYDKGGHIAVFFMWTFLWLKAIYAEKWQKIILIALLGILYGAVMEVFQGYIGRSPEILDLLADTVGVILGVCIYLFSKK